VTASATLLTASPRAHRRRSRPAVVCASVVMATVMVLTGVDPTAAGATSGVALDLANSTNGQRWLNGGTPFVIDPRLSTIAQAQANEMARTGVLAHRTDLVAQGNAFVPGWRAMAENVGVGASTQQVLDALMASPGHRGNILGDYNRLGVGVAVDGAGRVWVVQNFAKVDPQQVCWRNRRGRRVCVWQ
jgi:uncharacterized protein YkwD